MIVWGAIKRGADGKDYGVRYLLTREELAGLQAAGLLGDAEELVWMQHAADAFCAQWERDAMVAAGGSVQ